MSVPEIAAREYCRLRGVDPEMMVGHSAEPSASGIVPAVLLHSPAWTRAIITIRQAAQIQAAIAHAVGGRV